MPTLKNTASAPAISKKNRKVSLVESEQTPSSTQHEFDRSHKKRRHRDSTEEKEKLKKKRKRQEDDSGVQLASLERSVATSNTSVNSETDEAQSTNVFKRDHKNKQSEESNDVESDASQDEQSVAELLEVPEIVSKRKKKKSLPTFAIDPQLLHGPSNLASGSVETSPSPEPQRTRPLNSPGTEIVDYSMMTNATPNFMFTNDSIDPAAFGLGPGASTEDILRVIKNMDLSALTRPVNRNTASSSENGPSQRRLNLQNIRISTDPNTTDQAKLLSNKWLSTKDLKKLEEEQGLQYKRGPFSKTETTAIDAALKLFSIEHGISVEETIDLIFVGRGEMKVQYRTFWFDVASVVPMRPLISVFNYCKRAYHPLQKQGKWSPEEDKILAVAVAEFGQQWGKVGERVGRMGQDCRDRWRNYIQPGANRNSGPWSQEETDQLAAIMKEYGAEMAQRPEGDSIWREISQRMGGKRTRQQIRIKWQDSLSKQVKLEGPAPRWRALDSYILVHKVATMDVADDSEIDWNLLPDPDWNLWSAHSLQRRWLTMKRGVTDYENMPFAELLDILKAKKGSLEPSEIEGEIQRTQQTRLKERREPVSKETIDDSDAELESDG